MCIVALAWQLFDHMPVILLSNRDEFVARPTQLPHRWHDQPIYAPRDTQSGGTWIGHGLEAEHTTDAKPSNRWATVLNFRDTTANTPNQLSRGQLVSDFLSSNLSPMAFAKQICLTDYAGFNLLIGDAEQAVLVNNRGYPPTALHSGLHVISNGHPNDAWFKTERLRQRVSQELLPVIKQLPLPSIYQTSLHAASIQANQLKLPNQTNFQKTASPERHNWQDIAFEILSDSQQAPDSQLPDTGVGKVFEQAMSSIFIANEGITAMMGYGTRTQSILTLTLSQFGLRFETPSDSLSGLASPSTMQSVAQSPSVDVQLICRDVI